MSFWLNVTLKCDIKEDNSYGTTHQFILVLLGASLPFSAGLPQFWGKMERSFFILSFFLQNIFPLSV